MRWSSLRRRKYRWPLSIWGCAPKRLSAAGDGVSSTACSGWDASPVLGAAVAQVAASTGGWVGQARASRVRETVSG